MRVSVLILCVMLAACNMPGPGFRGLAPTRVAIDQSLFDVRVAGTRAQAIRVNREWAPRFADVAPRGAAAMAEVSGCRVTRIRGDQAVMSADLDCGPVALRLPAGHAYDCIPGRNVVGTAELICAPRL